MQQLKICFLDGAIFMQRVFIALLNDQYNCIIDELNPELCVYSIYGNQHQKYHCKKLCIIGENNHPNFDECDYAISPHHIQFGIRHCRVPLYVFNKEYEMMIDSKSATIDYNNAIQLYRQRQFCSAVISNNTHADPIRLQFMQQLHERMPIASIGKVFNTVGNSLPERLAFAENYPQIYTNPNKINFISKYKFNLALENSSVQGYITEKIIEAFIANTIPIYFGAPDISEEFNPQSFINVSSFKTIDECIDFILAVNDNENMYVDMLMAKNFKKQITQMNYISLYAHAYLDQDLIMNMDI